MFKIVFAGAQIISAIPSVFDIKMPDTFENFLSQMNFINLDVFGQLSAGCIAQFNFYHVLLYTCCIPLGIGVLLLLAMVVQMRWAGSSSDDAKKKRTKAKHMYVSLLFLLSYVCYPGASVAIFTLFPCDSMEVDGESVRYLKADYSIQCDTPEYNTWKMFAGVMLFIYPIGIPLLYTCLLYRDNKKINPKGEKGEELDLEAKLKKRERNHGEIKMISFLWVAYTPRCWWYEIFECLRRLLMTGGEHHKSPILLPQHAARKGRQSAQHPTR